MTKEHRVPRRKIYLHRLAIGLLPYALVVAGAIMCLIGARVIFSNVETSPTEVPIQSLEKGELPEAKWLKITDGRLYWPEGVRQGVRTKKGEELEALAHYVPLVSEGTVRLWLASHKGQRPVSYDHCRVIVRLSGEFVKERFPEMADGKVEHPSDAASLFEVSGTRQSATELPKVVKSALAEGVVNVDFAKLCVVDHGSQPMQRTDALPLICLGVFCLATGSLWTRARFRGGAVKAFGRRNPPSGRQPSG